jgi:hypothetical protein
MRLGDVLDLLNGRALSADFDPDLEFRAAYAADLMSDVLTYAGESGVLLTGLPNALVVRTAEVAGLTAIVFVRGKEPAAETVAMAAEKGIPLATTKCTMFEACGRLYMAGVQGLDCRDDQRALTDEKLRAFLDRHRSTRRERV